MDISRSSSASGTGRRLVFRGQGVNVVLPSVSAEIAWENTDILEMVEKIHSLAKDEVLRRMREALLIHRLYRR